MPQHSIRIDGNNQLVIQAELPDDAVDRLTACLRDGTVLELNDQGHDSTVLINGRTVQVIELGPPEPGTRPMHVLRGHQVTNDGSH